MVDESSGEWQAAQMLSEPAGLGLMRAARKLLSVLKATKLMIFVSSALAGRETCCNFLKLYERDDSSHLLMLTENQQKGLIGSISVHCGGLNSEM